MNSPKSKVQSPKLKRLSACLLALWTLAIGLETCSADLAVTATPGFVFSDTPSGRPTVANLNRALNMTYAISGSIGGTNAGLSAGSVSGTMLMDSVVDNVTVQFVGSPRGIEVMDGGINIDQLNVAVAGLGLGGGGGAALSNKTDNVSITITNDTLTLMTNLSATFLNVASNSVIVGTTNSQAIAMTPLKFWTNVSPGFTYTSSQIALNAGVATTILDTAHGFPQTPSWVRGVIVCQTSDAGYAVGDEVDMIACGGVENGGSFERGDVFAFGANATNVFCVQSVYYMYVNHKSTTTPTQLLHSRWKAKLYARP